MGSRTFDSLTKETRIKHEIVTFSTLKRNKMRETTSVSKMEMKLLNK